MHKIVFIILIVFAFSCSKNSKREDEITLFSKQIYEKCIIDMIDTIYRDSSNVDILANWRNDHLDSLSVINCSEEFFFIDSLLLQNLSDVLNDTVKVKFDFLPKKYKVYNAPRWREHLARAPKHLAHPCAGMY